MKSEVLQLLKMMMSTINRLTDDEVVKLMSGEGKLVFTTDKMLGSGGVKGETLNSVEPLITQLKTATNRTEATKLLSRKAILKKDLINLASILNVHINKSSSKAKIIEKIVEATVGVTLRSNAIKETIINK